LDLDNDSLITALNVE